MGKFLFIIKHNLKKKKSDVAVLIFLIALASLLLYTSISVFLGMGSVLDEAYQAANTADLLLINNSDQKKLEKLLGEQQEVEAEETAPVLYFLQADYRKEGEAEKSQMAFLIGGVEEPRTIGLLAGYDKTTVERNEILLPYYMKSSEGFAKGDTIFLTLGKKEYSFQIAGFVEDPMFAIPLNINLYRVYISQQCMEEIGADNSEVKLLEYKVRLKRGYDSFEFEKKMTSILNKEMPELSGLGVNWTTMKGGDGIMSFISMGIVLVFSVLLMVVILLIMRFSISNFMEMNRKNTGTLQAAGYTTAQMMFTTLMEMGTIAVVGIFFGLLLGVAGSNVIGSFEGMMLGVSWTQSGSVKGAMAVICTILGIVLLIAYLCGRAYKKLSVLDSLRGGIYNHNFKKNYFPFDKVKLPQSLIFAGKSFMQEKGKTISLFCIVAVLAFSSCVGLGLYENFGISTEVIMKMAGTETGNLAVAGENLAQIGKNIEQWEEVENVLFAGTVSISVESETEETTVTCDVWENPSLLHNEMIINGRVPKYENEIVLTTSIAKQLHVKMGDTVYVTGTGERLPYLVSGIDQKMNNMGLKTMLTAEGIERLNGDFLVSYLYIYTREGVSFEEMEQKLRKGYPENEVLDVERQVKEVTTGVSFAMAAICAVFVVITIFVVTLVEILLIRAKIIRERRNYGINKALGFTTRQLMAQTMMMNLPVIVLGSVFGVILSNYLMEPLLVAGLSFSGFEQFQITISPVFQVVTILGIFLVALTTSVFSSLRLRRIEPVEMIQEE
ncbi:MAG: ABC transporter permease [Lachnospiraceae bacterium]|nr:ABC transporter permease [Lachnospiraceae bacterium]